MGTPDAVLQRLLRHWIGQPLGDGLIVRVELQRAQPIVPVVPLNQLQQERAELLLRLRDRHRHRLHRQRHVHPEGRERQHLPCHRGHSLRAGADADSSAPFPSSGILGLAWQGAAVNNQLQPIQWAMQNGVFAQSLFTAYLATNPASNGQTGGQITFGALDTTNCQAVKGYAPLTSLGYWHFNISAVGAGSSWYSSASREPSPTPAPPTSPAPRPWCSRSTRRWALSTTAAWAPTWCAATRSTPT